ncbi:MAG: ferredoxin III, nif-specific [Gammaproteobacteria bacterium]
MNEHITGITRGGAAWTPAFVVALDQKRCIGCGRCFKSCPRDVFQLVEREGGESWDADGLDDEDDGFSDETAMVMSIHDALDCIGCEACSKVCPKNCLTHAPQSWPRDVAA